MKKIIIHIPDSVEDRTHFFLLIHSYLQFMREGIVRVDCDGSDFTVWVHDSYTADTLRYYALKWTQADQVTVVCHLPLVLAI